MRSILKSAAWIGMAVTTAGSPLLAQLHDNSEKQLTCNNSGYDSDRARHCEIREQSLPSIGVLNVDPGTNGGASVKGWTRNEVLVRTRIETRADNEGAAGILASRILIDGSGGQVRATGPEQSRDGGWSVTYEIFVPQTTDLTLKTRNGGLSVSDVRGHIQVETVNGGVNLTRVSGDVKGGTVNGGINVEMAGAMWDGNQMELSTRNGGVTLAMPAQYSARIQAETGMGRIQSDFPVPQLESARSQSRFDGGRDQKVDFTVGGGGAPIHITTGNGSIRLKRTGLQ